MINLMFCGNDKFYDGMLISLISIIKHTKEALNVYLITIDLKDIDEKYNPISEAQRITIENVIKEVNKESKVTLIDISKLFREDMIIDGKNMKTNYTPYIFLRLYADKISELPDKILYMDADIVCYDDIVPLYQTNIEDYDFAAAKDYLGRWFIDYKYINSGILLMNLKRLRENNTLKKCREMCFEKKMLLPDQTALNKCCDKKLYLPRKYNEQKERREDTVIRHFSKTIKFIPYFKTINIKPWQIDKIHETYKIHDFDDVLEKYLETVEKKNYV